MELAYAAGPRSSASNAARVGALDAPRSRHPGLRVTTVPCESTVDAGYRAADDIDLSRFATPSLTTATAPRADPGRRAWELLHRRVLDGARPDRPAGEAADGSASTVTPGLVVRASTGPVPRRAGSRPPPTTGQEGTR